MTFEETYPRYPFSELVRLALSAAQRIVRYRTWRETAAQQTRPTGFAPARPAH